MSESEQQGSGGIANEIEGQITGNYHTGEGYHGGGVADDIQYPTPSDSTGGAEGGSTSDSAPGSGGSAEPPPGS